MTQVNEILAKLVKHNVARQGRKPNKAEARTIEMLETPYVPSSIVAQVRAKDIDTERELAMKWPFPTTKR